MGIANFMAKKAHDRLKKCAEKEAGKTGTVIERFERFEVDEGGGWGTAARIMLMHSASAKQIQIFHMHHGDQRFLYVEPFDNAVDPVPAQNLYFECQHGLFNAFVEDETTI